MRFNITLNGITVSETDHLDIAQATVRGSKLPLKIVDNFTGDVLDVPAEPSVETTGKLPVHFIEDLLFQGKKIPAIKLVRELTNLGLGEAKGVVDRIQDAANARAAGQLDNIDPGW